MEEFYGNEAQLLRVYGFLKNPYKSLLVIHGASGSGVTHLLNACGKETEKRNKKAIYLTAEWFTEIIRSKSKEEQKKEFYEQLSSFDLVCVDNIQFFYRKKKSITLDLIELSNYLLKSGKKIIFGCSKLGYDITRSKKINWPGESIRVQLSPLAGLTVFKLLKRLCTPEDKIPDSLLFLISGYNASIEQYINCLISIRFKSRINNIDLLSLTIEELEIEFRIKNYFPQQQLRKSFMQSSLHFISTIKQSKNLKT
ncbi:MAG: ATP-binding protein [Sphingobacteriaceae bacterium]|nr:ATP-binding protein [Sphingobacteriaceae bacterium]